MKTIATATLMADKTADLNCIPISKIDRNFVENPNPLRGCRSLSLDQDFIDRRNNDGRFGVNPRTGPVNPSIESNPAPQNDAFPVPQRDQKAQKASGTKYRHATD
jgi:hypothetical protein